MEAAACVLADCTRISGGPDWLKKDQFDIQAKMPAGSPEYTFAQRQLPVYAMTIAKVGPKLKKAAEPKVIQLPDGSLGKDRSLVWTPALEPNGERSEHRSMQELADTLSMFMDRPVLDRTGLKGEFDFTLEYDKDPDAINTPGAALAGPAMFTAFREQLGIQFKATKGPVDILIIDHAEKPSEN